MTAPATKTVAQIKRTKKFKALITVGMDETAALKLFGHPAAAPVDDRLTTLIAAGFTEAEAKQHLADTTPPAAEPATAAPTPAAPLTSKELGQQLVEQNGFDYTKGCVYVTPDIIEATVRVRKTGKPETVSSSGVGRTKAVLLYKTDSGDVAIQNLTRPESA